jgi:NhaP-type Na+/H+ or K+/H+ antiporter
MGILGFIGFLICLFIGRFIEVWFFIKYVNKVCREYDIKYLDKPGNERLAAHILIKEPQTYFTHPDNHWSAYRFLFLSGPSFWGIFFHPGFLSLENIYNKYNIQKLKDAKIID